MSGSGRRSGAYGDMEREHRTLTDLRVQRCDAGDASSIVVTLAHRLRQLRARLCRRCTRCEAADAVERATGRINN